MKQRAQPLSIGASIALLALILRLLHVFLTAKLHVADDAVFFEQHASAFLDAWRSLGRPEFASLLRDAADHASLQGVVYPLVLSLFYWVTGGVNHLAAALVQAVLGAATVWLTYLTARRAFGDTAAVAAGALAAVYPPLVLTSGLLLAEAVLLFIQALAAYALVRGLPADAWRVRLLAGLAVGILMLRPAFQHAGILSLAGFAAAALLERRGVRTAARRIVPYLAGLLLIALPWVAMNGLVYGRFVWSRTGDAWQQVYWGIYPPNRGWWPPDSPVPPKYGVESLPGARAAGRQIDVRDLDYLEAAVQQVLATPLQAVATEMNKLVHGYLYPFNTYAENPPLVAGLAVPLHRTLAWLALAGGALAFGRPKRVRLAPALPLTGLALGVALPFLASHIDVRYVIPIALAALPFAGLAIAEALAQLPRRAGRPAAIVPATAIAAAALVWLADEPILLAVAPALEPLHTHRIHTALLCLALAGACAAVGAWLGVTAAGIAVGLSVAVLCTIQAFYDGGWHEWSTVLRPGDVAAQRIQLPPGWTPPPSTRAELRLYAQGAPQQSYVPIVRVNGREVAHLGPAFTEGGPLRFEERLMVTARLQGKARADVPQWYGVPIHLAALASGTVDVELSLDGPPHAWVRLWGDFAPLPGARVLEAPSVHSRIQGQDDSFHKLVSTGHPRLWRRVPLASTSAEPRLETDGRLRRDDLSPSLGRQTGEFRLRILIFGPAGELVSIF